MYMKLTSENTILCVKWGDKYGNEYVEGLKDQVEKNCSVPFNFYCLTDNPTHLMILNFLPLGMLMKTESLGI